MVASAALRGYLVLAFLARLAEEGVGVAVVLLALDRTGGAAQGAYVLTAWMAPHVLAAPLAGVLATRARSPRLFYGGALGCFALAIAALSACVGQAPVPATVAVALLGGSCGPVVSGGLSSLVATLAPAGPERDRAYGLDSAVYNAASVAGPAVVSVLVLWASAGGALLALALAAACAALLAGTLPRRTDDVPWGSREARPAPPTLAQGLFVGVVALWRVVELRAITGATCLAYLGLGGLGATAVLLADAQGSPSAGGALMTAFALGALAGALAVTRWWPGLPPQRLAAYCLWGTGAALACAAVAPSWTYALPLFVLAGLCDGPLLSATLRIRAAYAPPEARGQVFTTGAGLKISAAACGAALVGWGAALPASTLLLAVAGAQLVAAAVYVCARRVPRCRAARPPLGSESLKKKNKHA